MMTGAAPERAAMTSTMTMTPTTTMAAATMNASSRLAIRMKGALLLGDAGGRGGRR